MKPNRLDEIFQVKGGIPVIAGLYIGMDEEEAEDKLEELKCYTAEHSYEYPADLIYHFGINFEYGIFRDEDKVKSIKVLLPYDLSKHLSIDFKEYLCEKYYHERVDEILQKGTKNKMLGFMIDIYNDYYHFTLTSEENDMVAILLRATIDEPKVYEAFNTISQNDDLKEFIRNSLHFCSPEAVGEDFCNVLPINYGIPALYYFKLGSERISEPDYGCSDELIDSNYKNNPFTNECHYSYEVEYGDYDCCYNFIITLPTDSETLQNLIRYLRANILIEEAEYEVKYDKYMEIYEVKGLFKNQYLSIKIGDAPYYDNHYNNTTIEIKAVEEEHPEYYRAINTISNNMNLFSFFDEIRFFYKRGNDTQDAKFNGLRKKYETFEKALDDYIDPKVSYAQDMGGYSNKEFETDREKLMELWNTPGVDDSLPMSWVNVGVNK